ncbi:MULTISPECIES: 7TM diverse intracellular signaling domain-containing protein [Sphingobacterium]|uniref:histidine kinase n=1 Tax=Sphingobacterium litopenaei TaxID=2763500 RepID=A0ABR7YFU6_9SPHI|nr:MULTISPECIES: 7TM diverse intracellular signaling domain-containing protein [Sphingobacterium]MBD1430141.1 sensor histidine kinase [Sphingobacterium litopenaei]NGM72981.1 sensor histidine kinase [Sphingobacterium sp. SGL-16]
MNFRVILLVILIFASYLNAFAYSPVVFSKESNGKYIGKNISILKDPTRTLSFEQIVQMGNKFVDSNQDVPNLGVDGSNNWIRFSVKNVCDIDDLVINLSQVGIDEVVFYWVHNGKVDSLNADARISRKKFEFHHQFYLFEVPVKKGEQVECYLKLFNHTQLSAPISIHSPESLFDTLLQSDIFSAIYIGLMLSMILYNIFLYFSTRESHYFTYVNYIFWVVVAQLAILGLLEPLLAIESTWIKSRLLTLTGALSGLAAIFFVKSFLQTKEESPRFNKLLNIFIGGYLIAIGLLLAGIITPAYKMVNIVAGGGSTIVLVLAFRLSREKYRQTKYFLFAWCIFLISVLVYVLKDFNVLPYNFFTLRSIQVGSVIEAILLSFALGDKINVYRKEKEESQSKALKILLDNERLIREQNVMLEQKVEERTRELTESNESLQTTLTHLKETQSQLVEAEKMASLGQLTAGVAHEINNPINFVTSNVAPLRRDIDMIWEAIKEFESLALNAELSFEEKSTWIQKYKHELDMDYLKTEVEFLLKGMHEGASRTAEIVKSLRVFSRVDEDTLKFADINEGVESTMVILNSLVKDKIKVSKSYGDIPFVECYAGKLNQVFLNILSNAIYAIDKKFSEDYGGELQITTGLYEDGNSIFIKIADNGIGIPEDIKNRIFEPFFTTKDVGEGTGLGMSIAYNTVDKHNGKILIESEVGEGTTFIIVIPIKQTV